MNPLRDAAPAVRVYAADARAIDAARLAQLATSLDAQETARAARFVFDVHRRRFVVAHGFLREVLASETRRDARELRFETGPHGKPRLAESALHFNLTHTGEHALLAVGESELGLDAEEIRAERVDGPLARRVMTEAEFATWSQADRDERVRAFFRLWSAKESVMKATGRGLQLAPQTFAVFASGSLRLQSSVDVEDAVWFLQELESGPEFALALSAHGATNISRVAWR